MYSCMVTYIYPTPTTQESTEAFPHFALSGTQNPLSRFDVEGAFNLSHPILSSFPSN